MRGKSIAATQIPGSIIPCPAPSNIPTNTESTTFSLPCYVLAAQFPLPRANLPSPSLAPGRLEPSPLTPIDIPASHQPQFFPFQFQFLLIFETLISEMYGIIGLYCLAIYLCLSLCTGLILFSTNSQKKMLPLLLFGYHNSSRSPELLGSAAPRNFVPR